MYFNKNKALFYTLDAITSLIIIALALSIVNHSTPSLSLSETNYDQMHYIVEDGLQTIGSIRLKDINQTLMNEIISNTNITEADKDKTMDEIIIMLWVYNQSNSNQYIKKIMDYFINSSLFPKTFNYTLSIEDNSTTYYIYNTSNFDFENSDIDFMASSSKMVSGYKEDSRPYGYVARAWIDKMSKNETLTFPVSPEGGGNRLGNLEITKKFYLNNPQSDIIDAYAYISVHYGSSFNYFDSFQINGNELRNQIAWTYNEYSLGSGRAGFGNVSIKPYLQQGWNTMYLQLRNDEYNAHTHPGFRLEIKRKSDKFYNKENPINETIYMDNIHSTEYNSQGTGVWSTFDFYIPFNSNLHNATFYLNLSGLDDVLACWLWWCWPYWDVRVYLNGNLIDELDHVSPNFYKIYDLTQNVSYGTNYLLIYANTYGDSYYGSTDTLLFSDPENNPNGSSRIFLNYSLNSLNLHYGHIDITQSEQLGGLKENPKTYTKTFLNYEVISSILHPAEVYSSQIDVDARHDSISYQDVFDSVGPRGIPSSIYIDPSTYFNISENNYIRMEDSCSGCEFIPESSFEYTYLIPSQVPYGDIFETQEEANTDAQTRLLNLVGSLININDIDNSTQSTGNIPWMYGPVILHLQAWK